MPEELQNLDTYFNSLSSTQLAYLETLNRKNHTKDKDFKLTQNFNPMKRHRLVQENLAYLDAEEDAIYNLATERFFNAKSNSAKVTLATAAFYFGLFLFTAKKTTSSFVGGFKAVMLGGCVGLGYYGYEFMTFSRTMDPMFYRIVQQRLRRTVRK